MPTTMKTHLLYILPMLLLPTVCMAQTDERKWSLETSIGPSIIQNKTNIHNRFGVNDGFSFYLGMEYYLPSSPFVAKAGIMSDELILCTQDVNLKYTTLNIGGRWYPAPRRWILQPHLGLTTDLLLSGENGSYKAEKISLQKHETITGHNHSSTITFTPSVGVDLYLMSSIAIFAQYSYRIDTDGRYRFSYSSTQFPTVSAHGNLDHQNWQFGLKLTFPFILTSKDVNTLIDYLFDK